jgi:hypothetical protein
VTSSDGVRIPTRPVQNGQLADYLLTYNIPSSCEDSPVIFRSTVLFPNVKEMDSSQANSAVIRYLQYRKIDPHTTP